MAYEPTNWQCGDVVTAEKLNKLENAVSEAIECCESGGGGVEPLIVRPLSLTESGNQKTLTFDKSYADVREAMEDGRPCYIGMWWEGNEILCDAQDLEIFDNGLLPIVYCSKFEYTLAFMSLSPNDGHFGSMEITTATADEPLKLYAICGGSM